jgi:hypothetical protein
VHREIKKNPVTANVSGLDESDQVRVTSASGRNGNRPPKDRADHDRQTENIQALTLIDG